MCVHVCKLDEMETSAGKNNVGCCFNHVTHMLCSSLLSGSVWLWEQVDVTALCKIYLGVYNKGDTELFCQISVNWSPKIYKTCMSIFWVLISFTEPVINRADMCVFTYDQSCSSLIYHLNATHVGIKSAPALFSSYTCYRNFTQWRQVCVCPSPWRRQPDLLFITREQRWFTTNNI